MGFFVGWRYFNHNNLYHWEAVQERRRLEGIENRKKAAAAKRKKAAAAKRKVEKEKKREEWRKEADKNMRDGEERFGQTGMENGLDEYDKYSPENKNSYRDEIEARYGAKKFNAEEANRVNIKRGMGSGHHMQVRNAGENRYQGHSALGPQGGAKPPPGMDSFGMKVEECPQKYRGGGSSNIGGSRQPTHSQQNNNKTSSNSGGSSQLFNPFGGGGGGGSKLFRF